MDYSRLKCKQNAIQKNIIDKNNEKNQSLTVDQIINKIDSPLSDPVQDLFNRKEFARRISAILKNPHSDNSLVVGLYGEWGCGKTTILNFIEQELKNDESVIIIKFNPWRYQDEVSLSIMFFKKLSNHLSKSKIAQAKEIIRHVNEIPGLYILIQILSGSVVQGEKIKETLDKLTEIDIDESKANIDELLIKSNKRIIILIDDIDRLDKGEIQCLFKLVKQTADFKKTTYVLAFDEQMVAASLGEKYGSVIAGLDKNVEAGRAFIEKIVQIPVHVPMIDKTILLKFGLELVYDSLKSSKIELSDAEKRSFERDYKNGFSTRITNARVVKRFGNALMVTLPLLQEKVNINDLLLLEGIRIYYPKLYSLIKNNKELFIDTNLNRYSWNIGVSVDNPINKFLTKEYPEEVGDARYLIDRLFPRLNSAVQYSANQEWIWEENKNICSNKFFDRYLVYAEPTIKENEFEIRTFIKFLKDEGNNPAQNNKVIDNICAEIIKVNTDQQLDRFVSQLRQYIDKVPEEHLRDLAIAICRIGYLFDDPIYIDYLTTTFQRAAILVSRLISNIPVQEEKVNTFKTIIKDGQSAELAFLCYDFAFNNIHEDNIIEQFNKDELYEIRKEMVERILNYWSITNPLYKTVPRYACSMLLTWSEHGLKENLEKQMIESFRDNPQNAIEFLKCIPPQEYDISSRFVKIDFRPYDIDKVEKIVSIDEVYYALEKCFRGNLRDLTYTNSAEGQNKKIVKQFYDAYNVKKQEQKTKQT